MSGLTFNSYLNNALKMHSEGAFEQGYEYVTQNAQKVVGNEAKILNYRYSFAARAGHPDLAVKILKEAVGKGYWYSRSMLMEDEDLEGLRQRKDFLELVTECARREIEARTSAKSKCMILKPSTRKRAIRGTVIALHGNGESAELAFPHWNSCLEQGRTLALIQSSQISYSMGFDWANLGQGVKELEGHWRQMVRVGLDPARTVIGGFSAGCRVILHTVLRGNVEPSGVILVSPWLPDLDSILPHMDRLLLGDTRFMIVCGEQDSECVDYARRLAAYLRSTDESIVRSRIVPGTDHDFPQGWEDMLRQILSGMIG